MTFDLLGFIQLIVMVCQRSPEYPVFEFKNHNSILLMSNSLASFQFLLNHIFWQTTPVSSTCPNQISFSCNKIRGKWQSSIVVISINVFSNSKILISQTENNVLLKDKFFEASFPAYTFNLKVYPPNPHNLNSLILINVQIFRFKSTRYSTSSDGTP